MSHVTQCPACSKSLRLPEEKVGTTVRCPSCGEKFRAREVEQEPEEHEPRTARLRSRKSTGTGSLSRFLRPWLIACGGFMALALILTVAGIFSEPMALVASFFCIAGILGCILAGTIWTAIDLGRESLPHALLVICFPAAGPILAFQKKGPALRGAVVFASSVAPLLLVGLILLTLRPLHQGQGPWGRTAKWGNLVRQMDARVKPDTPVLEATIHVASRPGSLDGIEPRCESLLTQFKCYVPGSLRINAPAREISYKYRGEKQFESLLAWYLSSSTGLFTPQMPVAPTPAP